MNAFLCRRARLAAVSLGMLSALSLVSMAQANPVYRFGTGANTPALQGIVDVVVMDDMIYGEPQPRASARCSRMGFSAAHSEPANFLIRQCGA